MTPASISSWPSIPPVVEEPASPMILTTHHRAPRPLPASEVGVQAEIEHLAQIASVVLNAQVNVEGKCAVCSSRFPCQSAS